MEYDNPAQQGLGELFEAAEMALGGASALKFGAKAALRNSTSLTPGGDVLPAIGDVKWVDEASHMSDRARQYNDGATGARSNLETQSPQAPAIERTLEDETTREVRFDGIENDVLIDRKRSIVTTPKAKDQAMRQSEALRENSRSGVWEVPTESQKSRAERMLGDLQIANISVRVVEE